MFSSEEMFDSLRVSGVGYNRIGTKIYFVLLTL